MATPTATATPTVAPTPTQALPVITSPLIATGTVERPFVYQFQATGATSLGASNLPPGLTFNTSLRAIVGSATAPGTFHVDLSASNAAGTTKAQLTIDVLLPCGGLVPTLACGGDLIISSSTAATGRTGRTFSFQLQTQTINPKLITTHFAVDGLPPGLNLDPSTGFISGTPTADGNFSLAVSAIVGMGTVAAQSALQLTFTSDPSVPIITSAASAILTPGQPFTYTITADANGTFVYLGTDGIVHEGPSCAGLPAGLCFDGIDTISGVFTGRPISGVKSEAADRNTNGGPRRIPDLGAGIVTNVQLFATDSSGTGTFPRSISLRRRARSRSRREWRWAPAITF